MTPDISSLISAERIERAIQLRYCPFPELTMELLNSQLNQFRVGELRPAARTWEIMLERDGELSTPAEKLYSDIARLPWSIEKDEDSAEADAHAEALRYFYTHLTATSVLDADEIGGTNLLLRQLMTAHAFRYSVHEIGLQVSAASKQEVTATFKHCPVWFFEARKGQLKFLPREGDYDGMPLKRGRWLSAVGRGVMRQCSVAYAIKHFPLRDWLYFSSRFGIPGIQGLIDAQKESPEWNDFAAALEAFANRWITITSKSSGAEIRLIEAAKSATTLPFKDLVERSDRLYARVFRGGDLSTQSREGTDVAGANPQQGEAALMLQDGAQWATDCLNTRVDEPVIEYLFNTAPKAWIVIAPPKTTDTQREIAAMDFLAKNGGKVAIQTAHERLEIPQAEDGEDVLSAPQPAVNPFGGGPQPAVNPFGGGPQPGGEPTPEDDGEDDLPNEDATLDDEPDDEDEALANAEEADGVWRTIRGQPIFIPDGTSVAEAVKARFGSKGAKARGEKPGGDEPKPAKAGEKAEAESGIDRAAKEKIALKTAKQRAFRGEPVATKTKLSKQEAGALGERIVIAHLHARGMKDARPLNADKANYAVDLVQDHGAIEVKTGLVSNGKSAQQWRATIGQPGKEESKKLAKMSAEKKAAWNQAKADAILRRKEKAVAKLSKKLGRPVKSWTMTTILNPDTRTVDVYRFKGFHLRVPWNSDLARKSYVGSYKY